MTVYNSFIRENVAPKSARQIVVYNKRGVQVGVIPLGSMRFPDAGQRLFSFLLLSDVHVVYDTGDKDLRRALTYAANNSDISFTVISGDLTDKGTTEQLTSYKTIVDETFGGKPVYACAGNHEHYSSTSNTYLDQYTGNQLCFKFSRGDHVFLMVGVSSGTKGSMFTNGQLQWLYDNLEANRDKHCWIVQHVLAPEGSGDILGLYPYSKLSDTEGMVFKSLLKHYKNAIFVHGHSHMQFAMQKYGMTANYDKAFGIHSIHVPSCAVPRKPNADESEYETYYDGSEGYVVDVYKNGIHLRGRDFVNGEFLPIASYWLDTTLQTVAAGTYTDSTGTITT